MNDSLGASLDNIKSYMDEYGKLSTTKKMVEARMKELDELIRPTIVGKGATVVGNFMFECTMVKGRETLDKKAVEEAGIDLSPYYKTGAPFTMLKVKEVNTAS